MLLFTSVGDGNMHKHTDPPKIVTVIILLVIIIMSSQQFASGLCLGVSCCDGHIIENCH